jgi:hypothetical protein
VTYGCFNRPDYKPSVSMQSGWWAQGESRRPRMVEVPFRMSPRCEYTSTSELGQADKRCVGCARRAPALDGQK